MATECTRRPLGPSIKITFSTQDIVFDKKTDAHESNPTTWLLKLLNELITSLGTLKEEYAAACDSESGRVEGALSNFIEVLINKHQVIQSYQPRSYINIEKAIANIIDLITPKKRTK